MFDGLAWVVREGTNQWQRAFGRSQADQVTLIIIEFQLSVRTYVLGVRRDKCHRKRLVPLIHLLKYNYQNAFRSLVYNVRNNLYHLKVPPRAHICFEEDGASKLTNVITPTKIMMVKVKYLKIKYHVHS